MRWSLFLFLVIMSSAWPSVIELLHLVENLLNKLIHHTAYVSHKTEVYLETVVNTGVRIERGCIINLAMIINHDCIIEKGVHICLGSIIKGGNRIRRCEEVEAGEVVGEPQESKIIYMRRMTNGRT